MIRKVITRAFQEVSQATAITQCSLKKRRTFADSVFIPDNRVKKGERLADILLAQGNKEVIHRNYHYLTNRSSVLVVNYQST